MGKVDSKWSFKVLLFSNYSYLYKEKQYIPKNNELLLNKRLFLQYNEEIVRIFEDLLNDDDIEVLTQNELKQICRKNVFL